jgi:GTPase
MHKAGFVNIIGFPNAGKSTLLNALLGEKLVIVSPKAQTTRKRVLGIHNDDDCQIVFSDTPGFIPDPHYELHRKMNDMVEETFTDADLMIYITEPGIRELGSLGQKLRDLKIPLLVLINKADSSNAEKLNDFAAFLEKEFPDAAVKTISALHGFNVDHIIPFIKTFLKEHPPYFSKDDLSDRDVRFFVSEIIREKLLDLYYREIPYAAEVVIDEFREEEDMNRIRAIIYVERETQKMIILGKGGSAIKKLGTQSRIDIERFTGRKVYIDITVKVLKNWRNDPGILKKLGFQN